MKHQRLTNQVCWGGRQSLCCRLVAASALLAFSLASSSLAQTGLSGLPLDNFQFKAGHNSYDEDENMDDQLDNYNMWCVELDLQWETDCGPCITVDHCCEEVPGCWGEQRIWEATAEITRAADLDQGITLIYLEIKNSGGEHSGCHEPWPSERRTIIRSTLLGLLGAETVYTSTEFEADFAANGARWPSWQDLRDRGKKFILVLQDWDIDAYGKTNDPVLFIAVASLQEATTSYPWATFINVQDANTSLGIPQPSDRYLHRAWFDIHSNDHDTWELAASRGFNLICTDDVDGDYTILDSRTHSPQPLYVNRTAAARLWGTRAYPMNDLPTAITRASPGITMRIRPDNYPGPVTFDKPMRVEPDARITGMVIIGTP